MPDISFSIVSWNAKDYLDKCLDSIYKDPGAHAFEVIVVDNASSDGTVSMVRTKYPSVVLIENKDNPGFAAANNQALKICKSGISFILNPDTEILPGAVGTMADFLKQHEQAGAVGAKLLNADGTIQLTCARNFPSLSTEFFWLTTLVRRFPGSRLAGRYLMSYWDHKDRREVDCLSGACIMARTEVLKDLGFFDESFFMYGEDVDLCYRIKKAGWQVWYLPEAGIVHYGGGSSKGIREAAAVYDRIAISTFFRKHRGAAYACVYRAMCVPIGFGMSAVAGIIYPFTKQREKLRKVLFENIAILAWALGLRKK